MAATQTVEALQLQVEELRTALTTVTEALVLFQEFMEHEISEMTYFRDSGCYFKLVETLNKMRDYAQQKAGPAEQPPLVVNPPVPEVAVVSAKLGDSEEEEQVEVDVDYSDEDAAMEEITIRQVYSCPSIEKETAETLLRMRHNNSSITITPVFTDAKKKEEQAERNQQPHHYVYTQPSVIVSADKPPAPMTYPPMISSVPHPHVDQRIHYPVAQVDMKENQIHQAFINHLPPPPPVHNPAPAPLQQLMSIPVPLPVPQQIPVPHVSSGPSTPVARPKKTGKKRGPRTGNGPSLKRKVGRPPKNTMVTAPIIDTSDQPLDLQKKVRRPSARPVECVFCGKCYSSKGVMSRHIKEAHREEPQFPCFYCQSKFRNGPARLEHMNTAHPEDMNSVICPYCKRKSSSVAGKRNHMMLCVKKFRGTPTKTSTKAALTSPSDSGVEMEVSSSG